MVEIEEDDIITEVEYWKNIAVCYVLDAHPLYVVLNGFVQRLLGKLGIDKVAILKNGILLVCFKETEGKYGVIQGGIYHFDNKPFIMKA